MIHCTTCGKPIERLPSWLEGTKVTFVCNNCPNRQAKNIAFMSMEFEAKAKLADDDEGDLPEDESDDDPS